MSTAYICSFHIPKTGGTTFAHHLRTSLPAGEFFLHGPFARAERFMQDQPQLEETPPESTNKIRVVHGHGAGLEVAETMPERFPEYLIILRDPFERFVSGFNHFNGERRNNAQPPVSADDYLESRGSNFYSKVLFRHFKPLAGPGRGMTFERLLPILKSFKYFVITEHINEQVPLLCEQLHLPAQKVETRRVNTNKVDTLVDRARFDKVNEVDNRVYRQLVAHGGSLQNPFGYEPSILRDHLVTAWKSRSPQQRLAQAYGDLVDSLKKSLKLHAARCKLQTRPNAHVQDVATLSSLLDGEVEPWIRSLDKPTLSMAYFWSGVFYMESGQGEDAEKYFRNSIALNPKNDNSLARLAQLLAGRKNFTEASQLIDAAMALRPDRPANQKIHANIAKHR